MTAHTLTGPRLLDLRQKAHLVAFGVGMLVCLVTALAGAGFSIGMIRKRSFQSAYIKWLGRNLVGISLSATLIISLRRFELRTFLTFIRTQPRKLIQLIILMMIIILCPTLTTLYIQGSVLSAITGLYLCYPLVLYASSLLGVFGASSSTFLVALASATATLIKSTWPKIENDHTLTAAEQFIWIQLFMSVLIFTALSFVVIISDRDRAHAEVEEKVRVRTEELRGALRGLERERERAEAASQDKAVFLSFLCHELRNPLHAISNMSEFLLEDLRELEKGFDTVKDGKNGVDGVEVDGVDDDTKQTPDSFINDAPTSSTLASPSTTHNHLPTHLETQKSHTFTSISSLELPLSSSATHTTALSQAHAIGVSSTYMLALVNDVLDMGRFEAGRVRLEQLPVDLHVLLKTHFELAREMVRKHQVRFSGKVGEGVPRWVRTDPVRVQQVLNNLVGNAYKFTPGGGSVGVEVWVVGWGGGGGGGEEQKRPRSVDVGLVGGKRGSQGLLGRIKSASESDLRRKLSSLESRSGSSSGSTEEEEWVDLELSVSDSGIGMDPSVVSQLFRPYAQAAVSTMREYGGSGLGLAITDKIVKLMGGSIRVDTTIGRGSVFTVRLPLCIVGPSSEEASNAEGCGLKKRGGGGRDSEWRKDDSPSLHPTPIADQLPKANTPMEGSQVAERIRDVLHLVDAKVSNAVMTNGNVLGVVMSGTTLSRAASSTVDGGGSISEGSTHPLLNEITLATMAISPPVTPFLPELLTPRSDELVVQPRLTEALPSPPLPPSPSRILSTTQLLHAPVALKPSPSPVLINDSVGKPETLPAGSNAILIVDDSTINRSILVRMLQRILPPEGGWRIDQAGDGLQAVDLVSKSLQKPRSTSPTTPAGETEYKIIFMDIVMPNMDGYDATRRIRSLGVRTPIVITTANQVAGNAEAQRTLEEVGADEAVGKPFLMERLREVLRRYRVGEG
ncbi:hypothetical protein HDV00_012799 [Rhizophlyctis rosea]|nr:hypothetical protein HDV00_012799 [Rhizophlyctis rosea]